MKDMLMKVRGFFVCIFEMCYSTANEMLLWPRLCPYNKLYVNSVQACNPHIWEVEVGVDREWQNKDRMRGSQRQRVN